MTLRISKPGNLVREEPKNATRGLDVQKEFAPVLHEMKKHPDQWIIVAEGPPQTIGHVRHKLATAKWIPGKFDFTTRVNLPEKKEAKLYGRYVGASGR